MKKLLVVSSLVAASATASYAQELIAGFDFSNIEPSFTSASANYSDLAADGPASNPFGTFTVVDGNGGFADDIDFDNTSLTVGTTLDSASRVSGVNDTFTGVSGSVFSQNTPFVADATTGGFELTVNPGTNFTDFNLSFAAGVATTGDATLTLTYSVNGGSTFNALGVASIDDATASLLAGNGDTFSFNGASAEVASSIIFKGEWTSIDASTGVFLDNVQVSGTVVPEPSSFAAIAGALVLGFVATRRRVK